MFKVTLQMRNTEVRTVEEMEEALAKTIEATWETHGVHAEFVSGSVKQVEEHPLHLQYKLLVDEANLELLFKAVIAIPTILVVAIEAAN
jgi:hypothetical protein